MSWHLIPVGTGGVDRRADAAFFVRCSGFTCYEMELTTDNCTLVTRGVFILCSYKVLAFYVAPSVAKNREGFVHSLPRYSHF